MDVADDLANFDLIPYDETNWHLEDTTILFSVPIYGRHMQVNIRL
jgi:hypothetical protein